MCHTLLQVFGCGHYKEVCKTPCVYALATATPAPAPSSPAAHLGTPPALQSGLSQSTQPLARHPSIGSVASLPPPVPINDRDAIASQAHAVRTASLSNMSNPPQRPPSTTSLPPPPYSQDLADANALDPIPNFCAVTFARYLPRGNHPCFDCYMLPEYEDLRNRWMKMYFDGHPACKVEDVERLSGVRGVAERLGLVNVMRELGEQKEGEGKKGEGKKE